MAWKVILGGAMCAIFCGAVPDLGSGRVAPASPTKFLNIRVCTDEGFDKAHNECATDQRGRKLVSSKFICSVRFLPIRADTLQARIVYAGSVVASYTARITDKRIQFFSIADDLGTTALPSGGWRCEFSYGAMKAAATFLSGGPSGRIIGAAVCVGSDVIRRIGAATCRLDGSALGLRAPAEIACSGVFVRAVGKQAEIHLLSSGDESDRVSAVKIRDAIAVASVRFRPQHGRKTFASGTYRCRFSLKGEAVIQKPFTVTA